MGIIRELPLQQAVVFSGRSGSKRARKKLKTRAGVAIPNEKCTLYANDVRLTAT
jgi:hypothetical protein